MKPHIHPDYRLVLFHDTAADAFSLVGLTIVARFNKRFGAFSSKKES